VHTDIHDALVAYTDDAPPPAFTYDQIRRDGRRARRLRRIGAAAGVATTVAAVAVSISVIGRPSPPPTAAAADAAPFCRTAAENPTGPAIEPSTSIEATNGYPVRWPAEAPEHAAARMSCFLIEAVPALLPEATFRPDPSARPGTLPLEAYPFGIRTVLDPSEPVKPQMGASAVIADDEGVGTIGFDLRPTWQPVATAIAKCGPPSCSVRKGPHGETVIVIETTGDSGYREVTVNVYRGDTFVVGSVTNGVRKKIERSDQVVAGRKDLPITVDQLIELAAAPPLTLFP
jgi:hypothetical protein